MATKPMQHAATGAPKKGSGHDKSAGGFGTRRSGWLRGLAIARTKYRDRERAKRQRASITSHVSYLYSRVGNLWWTNVQGECIHTITLYILTTMVRQK